MVFKIHQPLLGISLSGAMLATVSCDEIGERISSMSLPGCDSQRTVAGWQVTSGLNRTGDDHFIISKWEASRDFSTFFGVRMTYNTSQSPTPYLRIWHDYKSGDVTIRFPEGAQLSTSLNARYATTTISIDEIYAEAFSRHVLQIEHTSHAGKWQVHQTNGLPKAIAAAKADLEIAKKNLDEKNCALG